MIVAQKRLQFHHDVANQLVRRFDTISVEDLNIQGLARGRLSKQILDAAWGEFVTVLSAKAECACRKVVAVNPRGTSQKCSGCGAMVPKTLSVRTHSCPHCGLIVDRDVNAAINILQAGTQPSGSVGNGMR